MEADLIEERDLYAAIAKGGARALLIGRRALIALGLPMVTADYDFWIHIDDIALFNAALEPLGLVANRDADQARARGRYVLENGEHVDVMVARGSTTQDGEMVLFDDVWPRRREIAFGGGVLFRPTVSDLIRTKRWAMRPHDVTDIHMLEALLAREGDV